MDIHAILPKIAEYISLYGIKVIAAVAIFVIGKWLSKKLVAIAKQLMGRAKVDETLVSFAGNVIYSLALAFVSIAALGQLGVQTTSLAAVIAAAGLAVGLALQGSLSNLAAGVMIILFRPFKLGDYVEAGGSAGTVEEISIFTTSFRTPDNRHVIVPNSHITAGIITNISAKPERRIDLIVGVGYGDDLAKVKKVLSDIVAKEGRILKDKDVAIGVAELADSAVNLFVQPWVKSGDYGTTRADLLEKIKTTFDQEDISIPFPQRDLHIVSGAVAAEKKAA